MNRAHIDDFIPVVTDRFVPPATVAMMREELQFCFWTPSTVLETTADGGHVSRISPQRRSETTHEFYFPQPLLKAVRAIEKRLATVLEAVPDCFETWQATHYGEGGGFNYHFDAGRFGHEPAGERRYTVQLYLTAPAQGGETHFKILDLGIEPRPGRLVVWRNVFDDGSRNPAMLHAGAPIRRGEKLSLITWVRERPVRTTQLST